MKIFVKYSENMRHGSKGKIGFLILDNKPNDKLPYYLRVYESDTTNHNLIQPLFAI